MLTEVNLPSKHYLYTLAGGMDEELLEGRRQDLSLYLDKILKLVGGCDSGFWNHPVVMTFLDIPMSSLPVLFMPGALEIDTLTTWDKELEAANEAVNKANDINLTRVALMKRGSDSTSYSKNLRRQTTGIQKKLERLTTGLLNLQKDQITGALQTDHVILRQKRLEQLRTRCIGLIDEVNDLALEELDVKSELLSSPKHSGTPPTPTTPGKRNSLIPDDIADALRHQHDDKSPDLTLMRQMEHMAAQDQKLADLEVLARRNKEIAKVIRDEVKEQNRILEDIAIQTDETNANLKVAQRRIKKI